MREIRTVEYSATPNGTIYDLMSWNEEDTNNQSSKKTIGTEGEGYISSQRSYVLGRKRQDNDLCGKIMMMMMAQTIMMMFLIVVER